jgi:lipid-A-disaccharide synthase
MPRRILVSAGEASGDLYASLVVEELRRILPGAEFFGCTGPRLRAAGVRTVVDAASLAVVGLVEVLAHIPRIYGEYRKLLREASAMRPDLAILTDSPDFHLRVARKLHGQGVPVVYLVAPQAWAWRKGRVKGMRRNLRKLLCIFPFEEEFFRREGVDAEYIGHPLAGLVRASTPREEFFRKHSLVPERPLVSVLPGSRRGESARHVPALLDAIQRISNEMPVNVVLPASANTGTEFFRELLGSAPVKIIEGESWDAMAHSDLALAASGTVTVEAALLGTPMVTFYKVSAATWRLGRPFVKVPFYSMVNLIAGRPLVPELIQDRMTGENLAGEALQLLRSEDARSRMKQGLEEVTRALSGRAGAPGRAALAIQEILEGQVTHVS